MYVTLGELLALLTLIFFVINLVIEVIILVLTYIDRNKK